MALLQTFLNLVVVMSEQVPSIPKQNLLNSSGIA